MKEENLNELDNEARMCTFQVKRDKDVYRFVADEFAISRMKLQPSFRMKAKVSKMMAPHRRSNLLNVKSREVAVVANEAQVNIINVNSP